MSTEDKVLEAAEAIEEDIVEAVHRNPFGFALGGFVVGAAVGGGAAFFFVRRHLETKYNQIAEAEIDSMREHYHNKTLALEGTIRKENVEVVETLAMKKGYMQDQDDSEDVAAGSPMVVKPPTPEPDRAPRVRNIFADREVEPVEFEWNGVEENKKRSPDIPYVIHYDEIAEMDDYQSVTLTYYDGDGVLCNDRDEIFDPADLDRVIGEKNLERFGHGSNDPLVVYIRNDDLELIYEIVKTDQSYAEAVHGFTRENWEPKNRLKARTREHDEQDRG